MNPSPGSFLSQMNARVTLPPLDREAPRVCRTATFGMGCFHNPDARFGCLPGVVRTRVGFASGGPLRSVQVVQIDYDPERTSFGALLDVFQQSPQPTGAVRPVELSRAIFCHDVEQCGLARSAEVLAQVQPLEEFQRAPTEHQKHHLRRQGALVCQLENMFETEDAFLSSPTVSRVNGYVGGFGRSLSFQSELSSFGLTASAQGILRSIVSDRFRRAQ